MATKKKKLALFIADIQDLWLFEYFLYKASPENIDIVYDKSRKITSPHDFTSVFQLLSNNVIRFEGKDSDSFTKILDDADYFMTKDCLPFLEPTRYAHKMVSISWVGESSAPACKTKKIIPDYHRFYVEKHLQPVYKKRGFDVSPTCPKYYFLNRFDRKNLCLMLGLDHTKKFVTVFVNNFYKDNDKANEIFNFIESFWQKKGMQCILKNKQKYGKYKVDSFSHDKFFDGGLSMLHTGIALQAVSEFSIGFATSAAIESETIGGRFVSFWGEKIKDINHVHEKIISGKTGGKVYRLARSKDTYNVCTSSNLSDIIVELEQFLEDSCNKSFKKEIVIDDFLRDLRSWLK